MRMLDTLRIAGHKEFFDRGYVNDVGQLVCIRALKAREGVTVDDATKRKIKDATGQTPGQFMARFGIGLSSLVKMSVDEIVAFVERRLKAEHDE